MAKITKFLYYKDGRPAQIAEDGSDSAEFSGDVQILGDLTVDGEIVAQSSSNVMLGDVFLDLNIDGSTSAAGIAHIIEQANTTACTSVSNGGDTINFSALALAGATAEILNADILGGHSYEFEGFDGSKVLLNYTGADNDSGAFETAATAAGVNGLTFTDDGTNVDLEYSNGFRGNSKKVTISGPSVNKTLSFSSGVGFAANDVILLNGVTGSDDEEMKGLFAVVSSTATTVVIETNAGNLAKAKWIQTQIGDGVDVTIDFSISSVAMTITAIADGTNQVDSSGVAIDKGHWCQLTEADYSTIETNDLDTWTESYTDLQAAYDNGNEIILSDGRDLKVSPPTAVGQSAALDLGANKDSRVGTFNAKLDLESASTDHVVNAVSTGGLLRLLPSIEGAQYGIKEFIKGAISNGGDDSLSVSCMPLDIQDNLVVGDLVQITAPVKPEVFLSFNHADLTIGDTITLSIVNHLNAATETVVVYSIAGANNAGAREIAAGADAAAFISNLNIVMSDSASHGITPQDNDGANVTGFGLSVEDDGGRAKITISGMANRGNTGDGALAVAVTTAGAMAFEDAGGGAAVDFAGGLAAKLEKASANTYPECKGLLGFVIDGSNLGGVNNDGDTIRVAGVGSVLRLPSSNYDLCGSPLYLSTTAGAASATPPSGSADVVYQVGIVLDGQQIVFMPQFIAELP